MLTNNFGADNPSDFPHAEPVKINPAFWRGFSFLRRGFRAFCQQRVAAVRGVSSTGGDQFEGRALQSATVRSRVISVGLGGGEGVSS